MANADNSVIELNAATGSFVKAFSGPSYQFDGPISIAADAAHVWVANSNGNSVTELNASTGALVRGSHIVGAGSAAQRALPPMAPTCG